jgi:hypothetical protein
VAQELFHLVCSSSNCIWVLLAETKKLFSSVFHTSLQGVKKQKSFASFSGCKPDSQMRSNTKSSSKCLSASWSLCTLAHSTKAVLSNVVMALCYNYTGPCFLHITQMLIYQPGVSWQSFWTSLDQHSNSGNLRNFWGNIQLKFENVLPVQYSLIGKSNIKLFLFCLLSLCALLSCPEQCHLILLYLKHGDLGVGGVA